MGALTRGAESTRPSRTIARFWSIDLPDTSPSVSVSALLSSRVTECVDPCSAESETVVGVIVPSDFPNSKVVVPALSQALAGPSELKAGAVHVPSAEEVTRRSFRGFPAEAASPEAALLHPARSRATAARTVKWRTK